MNTGIQLSALRQRIEKRGVSIVITGADGSGKTTLAKQLGSTLEAAQLPSRYVHFYAWHTNLLLVPFLILRNKFISKAILILDRSIYDNVAVFAAKRGGRIPLGAAILHSVYPKFDHAFYLHADRNEIKKRRPETDLAWHGRLTSAYEKIIQASGHRILSSDNRTYSRVVAALHEDICQGRSDRSVES